MLGTSSRLFLQRSIASQLPKTIICKHRLSTAMTAPRIILVTGSNSGSGYETVKAFLQSEKPYHIIAACRTMTKAEQAIEKLKKECPATANTIEPLEVSLNSDESIEKAYEHVKGSSGRLDVLINNAG